jgi:hypothetical protein
MTHAPPPTPPIGLRPLLPKPSSTLATEAASPPNADAPLAVLIERAATAADVTAKAAAARDVLTRVGSLSLGADEECAAALVAALDITLALARDGVAGVVALRDVKAIDPLLRSIAADRPALVASALALSTLRLAAQDSVCLQAIFTAGGIPVFRDVLAAAATNCVSEGRGLGDVERLSVAHAAQVLSLLSAKYGSHFIKLAVGPAAASVLKLAANDDRVAAALCSFAAKFLIDEPSAVRAFCGQATSTEQPFVTALCDCIVGRCERLADGSARVTGDVIIARAAVALAVLCDGPMASCALRCVGARRDLLQHITGLARCAADMGDELRTATDDDMETLQSLLRFIHAAVATADTCVSFVALGLPAALAEVAGAIDPGLAPNTLLLALMSLSDLSYYVCNDETPSSAGAAFCDAMCAAAVDLLLWDGEAAAAPNAERDAHLILEVTRSLGNVTRTSAGIDACCAHRLDQVVATLLSHSDPRVQFNCLGIVTNLASAAVSHHRVRGDLSWYEMTVALVEP